MQQNNRLNKLPITPKVERTEKLEPSIGMKVKTNIKAGPRVMIRRNRVYYRDSNR